MCVVVGAGALAAGGAVAGGVIGSSGAKSAAKESAKSADAAVDEQRRQYDQTRTDQQPWMGEGRNALSRLGDFSAGNMSSFYTSPNYEFTRNEGQRGIQQTAAAQGGLKSGNALKALAEFNNNLSAGQVNNWWNQQAGLAGVGQAATNAVGQFGQQTANNVGNALMAGGDARASGIMGQANSWSGALNSGLNSFAAYNGGMFGGRGGGYVNNYSGSRYGNYA